MARGFNSRAGSAYSSCGPAARVTRTRGENPGLGLERRPPGRALDIYLRLRHDDNLSPRRGPIRHPIAGTSMASILSRGLFSALSAGYAGRHVSRADIPLYPSVSYRR